MGLYSYIEGKYLEDHSTVSITGGGGKTTFLIGLSRYLKSRGRSVLLTTTTKFQSPDSLDFHADRIFFESDVALRHAPLIGESVYFARRYDERKCCSPCLEDLKKLSASYDMTLIEADGARCRPLKMHTEKDPVILDSTTLTVAFIGARSIGMRIEDACCGCSDSGIVDISFIQKLIDSREGVLKGARGSAIIVVNQCDEVDMSAFRCLSSPVELLFASAEKDIVYGTL